MEVEILLIYFSWQGWISMFRGSIFQASLFPASFTEDMTFWSLMRCFIACFSLNWCTIRINRHQMLKNEISNSHLLKVVLVDMSMWSDLPWIVYNVEWYTIPLHEFQHQMIQCFSMGQWTQSLFLGKQSNKVFQLCFCHQNSLCGIQTHINVHHRTLLYHWANRLVTI